MNDPDAIIQTIRVQAAREDVRVTQHAQHEMAEEAISIEDLLHAISNGTVLENYPEHRRGACCLLHGRDASDRDIHLVLYRFRTVTPRTL